MRHRGLIAVGAVTAAAIGSAVIAGRSRGRKWRAEADPAGADADLLALPPGRSFAFTTSDGASLAVTDAGTGPLVVLAHCYTGTRGVWAPVARRLVARGHRVVLWDQRGHGESTTGSDDTTVARLGTDLRELLDHLDATDAVLAGHSMGGMTVMACVGDHRDVIARRARALVLVSTAAAHLFPYPVGAGLSAAVAGSGVATFVGRSALGPYFARGTEGSRPVWSHLEASARMYAETQPAARAALIRSFATMDLRPGLADCPVPAMVVVGTADRLTERRSADDIVAHMPDAELVVLPGAGHMLPLEEPDRVAGLIAGRATGRRAGRAG